MGDEKTIQRALIGDSWNVTPTGLQQLLDEAIPQEKTVEALAGCVDGTVRYQALYIETNEKQFSILCDKGNGTTHTVLSHSISGNLAQRLQFASASAGIISKGLYAPAILWPEGQTILAKVAKEKPITWREILILIKLAKAGEKPAEEALQKPLGKLLGTQKIKNLSLEDLSALSHIGLSWIKYWDTDLALFAPQIYNLVLPMIHNNSGEKYKEVDVALSAEEAKKVGWARKVMGHLGSILQLMAENPRFPTITQFFLSEIIQKPNPETARFIDSFLQDYKELPKPVKEMTEPFFKKYFKLDVAQESFDTYFNSCDIFSKICLFLFRRFHRLDARQALIDQMLNELGSGEVAALQIVLKELVEKDHDPVTILSLKTILGGFNKSISTEGRALVLREILSLDKAYKIFEPFIKGQEKIDVEEGGVLKKKHFDLEWFARTDLKPFYTTTRQRYEIRTENTVGVAEGQDWKNYCLLIWKMMQRHLFKAVQGHLTSFYTSLDAPKDPEGFILRQAFKYPPMQDFLLGYVKEGDPFLGYNTLDYALNVFDGLDPHFAETLSRMPLDSIRERIRVKADAEQPQRVYVPPDSVEDPLLTAEMALQKGFEKAEEFIRDGIAGHRNLEDRIRHVFVSYFTKQLSYYSRYQDDPRLARLVPIREALRDTSLAYLPALWRQLTNHPQGIYEPNSVTGRFHDLRGWLSGDLGRMLPNLSAVAHNRSVLDIIRELYALDQTPFVCAGGGKEEEISSSLRACLSEATRQITNNWVQKLSENPDDREAWKGIQQLLGLLKELATSRNYSTDRAIDTLVDIGSVKAIQNDVIRTLMQIAEEKGYGTMQALWKLYQICTHDGQGAAPAPVREEIRTFLKNYNPAGVIDTDCHPTGRTWQSLLVEMIKMGNREAYNAWSQFLVDAYWKLAEQLPGIHSLKELDERILSELYWDLMELGRFALSKEAPNWLAPRLAHDIHDLYTEGPDTIDWVLGQLATLAATDPLLAGAVQIFNGENGPVQWLLVQALAAQAKVNNDARVWLTLLAKAKIGPISKFARQAIREENAERVPFGEFPQSGDGNTPPF